MIAHNKVDRCSCDWNTDARSYRFGGWANLHCGSFWVLSWQHVYMFLLSLQRMLHQLKCLQSSCLCLLKSPPQTYTINAYNEEKWYRSTHTQRQHPMGVSGQIHGPGKASVKLCTEACWYPEPILTLRSTEKFSYPYRRSNPEHSVVQSLVLEWSFWYRKVTHWCKIWVI